MHVKSSLSEPSQPPATKVPSGGSGSHTSPGISILPSAIRQPRPRPIHQPVPKEPLSLRRVALQNLRGLSLNRIEVHPRRPLIHERMNLPPRPLIQIRQSVTVLVPQRRLQIRVAVNPEHILNRGLPRLLS